MNQLVYLSLLDMAFFKRIPRAPSFKHFYAESIKILDEVFL